MEPGKHESVELQALVEKNRRMREETDALRAKLTASMNALQQLLSSGNPVWEQLHRHGEKSLGICFDMNQLIDLRERSEHLSKQILGETSAASRTKTSCRMIARRI